MEVERRRLLCGECGIVFWVAEEIVSVWQKSGRAFRCPNGHVLCWVKTPHEDEIRALTAKVKALEGQLATAQEQAAKLRLELDIWKPEDK